MTIPATYFGLSSYIHRPQSTEAFPSVPFGIIRSWDTFSEWNNLETSNGVYNWANLDWLVNLAQAHGVELLYTFGATPSWAATNPSSSGFKGAGSNSPPSNISYWQDFVTALVTRYAGRIKYYEIWNEANLTGYWNGTIPQLVTMEQTASAIIRAIDPAAQILTPSCTAGATNISNFLNNYFSAGGGAFSDIVAFHGYPLNATTSNSNPSPEYIITIVNAVKTAMSGHGITYPIWDTEGSWGSTTINDFTQQANYTARQYILHWSLGIARFIWYSWDSTTWGTLWDASTGIRPAGVAYGVLHDWLVGSVMTAPASADSNGTYTCPITMSNGDVGLIVWHPAGSISYTLPATYTEQLDISGNTVAITTNVVTVGQSPLLFRAASAPSGSITISGTVTDAVTGLPLSGATITTSAGPSTTTDASGNYTITGLSVGSTTVTVSLTGYTTTSAVVSIPSTGDNFALAVPTTSPCARTMVAQDSLAVLTNGNWQVPQAESNWLVGNPNVPSLATFDGFGTTNFPQGAGPSGPTVGQLSYAYQNPKAIYTPVSITDGYVKLVYRGLLQGCVASGFGAGHVCSLDGFDHYHPYDFFKIQPAIGPNPTVYENMGSPVNRWGDNFIMFQVDSCDVTGAFYCLVDGWSGSFVDNVESTLPADGLQVGYFELLLRSDPGDSLKCYSLQIDPTRSAWSISKSGDTGIVSILAGGSLNTTLAVGDEFLFEVGGSTSVTLCAYQNGTFLGTGTDTSSPYTSGAGGWGVNNASFSPYQFTCPVVSTFEIGTGFCCGTVSGGGGPPPPPPSGGGGSGGSGPVIPHGINCNAYVNGSPLDPAWPPGNNLLLGKQS